MPLWTPFVPDPALSRSIWHLISFSSAMPSDSAAPKWRSHIAPPGVRHECKSPQCEAFSCRFGV